MKFFRFLAIVVILISFSSYGQDNEIVVLQGNEKKYEYDYAFIEATRQIIFKNYNQAFNIYQRCYEYNPNSAALNFQLSKLYFYFGKVNEAIYHGQKAIDIDKNNKWYLINLLNLYQAVNKIDSAININYKLIDNDKENIELYINLSILYQSKGDYKRALNIYKYIESKNKNIKEIYINKFVLLKSINRKNKAIRELRKGLDRIPDDIDIIKLIAEYYRDNNKYEIAGVYYKKIIDSVNVNLSVVFSYIDFLIKYNRTDEALNEIKSLLQSKTFSSKQIVYGLIRLIENSNRNNQNKVFFNEIIDILYDFNNNDIDILKFIVDYELKEMNFYEASEKLKLLVKYDENNFNHWEKLLFVENSLKRYEDIITYSDKANELFGKQPIIYLYKGIAYQQLNNFNKSIETFSEGLRFIDNERLRLQFYILLAESYYKNNDYINSFIFFEKALAIDSNNIVIRNNYAYYLALNEIDLEKAERLSKYTIEKEKKNYIYLDTYAYILYKMNKIKEAKYYIKKSIKFGGKSNVEIMDHYYEIMRK